MSKGESQEDLSMVITSKVRSNENKNNPNKEDEQAEEPGQSKYIDDSVYEKCLSTIGLQTTK